MNHIDRFNSWGYVVYMCVCVVCASAIAIAWLTH